MSSPKTSSPNEGETSLPAPGPASELAGKRVLICEDEGVTLMQLRRMLTQAGMVVADVADNGEAAIEAALREKPDLILMDIRMPKLDGLQAAERILAENAVCIVMLTAFSDEAYQRQAEAIGTCGYVVKPVSRDSLLPALRKALEKFPDEPS